MDEECPLPLPAGLYAKCLPLEGDDHKDHGHDTAWIIETLGADISCGGTWVFGKPDFRRHLCLHRFKLWWLKPSHGTGGLDVPEETSLLLAEAPRGPPRVEKKYVALLPVSDANARARLHRTGAGRQGESREDPSSLALSADTGDSNTLLPEKLSLLFVAAGNNPFSLVRRLVHEAVRRLREQLDLPGAAEGKPPGRSAAFADMFGWCTWDSFYTMVTPQGIFEGLSDFSKVGFRPRWVVIDDGWQWTTNDDALNTEQWDERLVGLEANKRFRHLDEEGKVVLDLGDTVRKMKTDFGVEQVLTWHAVVGYWAGVAPEAGGMQAFNPFFTRLLAPEGIRRVDPQMQPELDKKRFGMVPVDRIDEFFQSYHAYLKSNGVNGVKVDTQSIIDCVGGGNGGVPRVARAYQRALASSVQATFKEGDQPAALINCMCHAPSMIFQIAAVSEERVVIRGSDDFYPEEDNSHGPHLYTNAYNALLVANLGMQDWDMFQSGLGCQGTGNLPSQGVAPDDVKVKIVADEAVSRPTAAVSSFHAAARAISGGPVYVSDKVGEHSPQVLGKLVLSDGSVLRAVTNALPTLDCLMRDPQLPGGGLLQIWAMNALPGTGVVGSFNVRGASYSQSERTWVRLEHGHVPAVKGTVSPCDVHTFNTEEPQAASGVTTDSNETSSLNKEEDASRREPTYALYLHNRKEVRVVGLQEATPLEVLPLGFELATFSKVVELGRPECSSNYNSGTAECHSSEQVIRWAPIGLAEMFNSSAAVCSQEFLTPWAGDDLRNPTDGRVGHVVACLVKGSGRFLAVTSRPPESATLRSVSGNTGGKDVIALDLLMTPTEGLDTGGDPEAEGGGRIEPGDSSSMYVVEVDIPGPWDGAERQLLFSWE